MQLLNLIHLNTGRIEEETLEGVGSRFSLGEVINYSWNFQYVLIRLQNQEIEYLESYKEGDVSWPSPSQQLLFLFRVNLNPSLVPHTESVVSNEVSRFPLMVMLRMNIRKDGMFSTLSP